MKKLIYIALIFVMVGFAVTNLGNKTIMAKEQLDLLTMADTVEKEQVEITGWSLHARERVNFSSLEDVKKFSFELEKKFPNWQWEVNSNDKEWEAKGASTKTGEISQSIQVVTTLTFTSPQTYIIYEVRDNALNNQAKQFLQTQLPRQFSDIFRGKPTIFSCIKGEFSDKMNKSLPTTMNHLLKQFEAEEVESLQEDNFISTSAYTHVLSDTITTKNKEMNLQLGIRTEGLGGETTLVVGTPIITIEY